jgi:hypothetical protein
MDSVALPIAPPYLFPFAPDLGPRRRAVAIEETIGLSPRVARALSQAGIGTFEQLAELSVAELLEIPDLGFAALSEIHDTLHKLGLAGQQTEQRPQPLRTSLEEELWRLTAPAGAAVERGIAMVYFGWDGRLAMEEIRDRYRVRRDLLRRIFLAVETQPPPDRSQVRSIRLAARFVAAHSPLWLEDAETLLHTAGLVQQQLTLQGLQQACRIAGIPSGLSLVRTPRLLVVHQSRLEECRIVVRTLQHLAALRGTTTIDEVKSCSEKMLDRELDRKFVRRSMALISTLRWLDPRLGIATLAS